MKTWQGAAEWIDGLKAAIEENTRAVQNRNRAAATLTTAN